MSIESLIRTKRIEKNLTLKELGDEVGVTAQAVDAWEIGRSKPALHRLFRLSQVLGVSLEELAVNVLCKVELK